LQLPVVHALLAAGCNILAQNEQGNTALHVAAVNGRADACKALMEAAAASAAVRNAAGQVAAEVAKSAGIAELCRGSREGQ
jgi:ankyrin repeat protein